MVLESGPARENWRGVGVGSKQQDIVIDQPTPGKNTWEVDMHARILKASHASVERGI